MSDQITEQLQPGRPIVLRGGTVLPMDGTRSVLRDTDVLVVGDRIEALGANLTVRAYAFSEIPRKCRMAVTTSCLY